MNFDWLPFVVAATGSHRVSYTRIIEAVIIAAVTSGATSAAVIWRALPVIEERLSRIEQQLEQFDKRDQEQDRKLYEHEGRLRAVPTH